MFLPHDVSTTRNAYHAFMAALCAFEKYKRLVDPTLHTLVCPALCCGYGKMAAETSAAQVCEAYHDFVAKRRPVEVAAQADGFAFVTASKDDEQPDNYDNREIKDVDIRRI
jgi:hypothetical protein